MHDSKIFHKRIGKMGQKQGFLNLLKDVINFYWICSIMKIISFLFAMFSHKSYIWEKKFSWDMGQNILSQSDGRIF